MIYCILSALILIADFISKHAAMHLKNTGEIQLIKNVLHLTYTENRGIAFGAFSGGRIIFIAVSVLLLTILWIYFIKHKKEKRTIWQKSGTALIVAGAIGNMIDRIFYGYVVDFINFALIDFPVFNIADIAVCVGVALLAIHILFFDESEEQS